ncbi:MAG: hypothetical protein QOI56_2107 [Actinomycetota bacterium]|nr:hypothetical protein [Actinomycetota bacterium]
MRVFLSYRRRDVGGYAGRLVDALTQRLGARNVFQDVAAIEPGQDFDSRIDEALEQCDTVLAVIGPGWLTAATPEGILRLSQPDDYVRRELARALASDTPVVPVLVGDAALPAAADLPPDLAGLVHRQAIELHDETWHDDVDGLVRALRGEPAAGTGRGRRGLVAGGLAAALVVVVSVGAWLRSGGGGGGGTASSGSGPRGSEAGYPACPPVDDGWTEIPLGDDLTGVIADSNGMHLTIRVVDARWRPLAAGKWQVTMATTMEHDGATDAPHGSWYYDYLAVGRRPFEVTCFSADPAFVRPGLLGDAVVGFEVACEPVGSIALGVGDHTDTIDVSADRQPGAC